ncbi:MAG TPA: hypothetical protein VGL38_06125 [bacterium]|jgi:hypothetical protein
MKPFILTIALFCLFTCAHAQDALVPLDSTGKVESITADLQKRLQLFGEYSNFREARLFRLSDTLYVLEVLYRPDSQVIRERKPLTADGVATLRRQVGDNLLKFAPNYGLNQDGRAQFVRGTTTLALGYYGWAVPAMMDVGSSASAVAGYLLIGSAGYFVPYLTTRNSKITDGMASMAWYGGSRGIAHGMLLDLAISGKNVDTRGLYASGVVVSVAEMLTMLSVADKFNITSGQAALLAFGGDYGFAFGAGAAQLARFYDGSHQREAVGTILAAHGAGILMGKLMYDVHPYTKGDAHVLESVTILGGGVMFAVADMLGTLDTDGDVFLVTSMLGSVAGFAAGHSLTRHTSFTEGQGSLIALGELGGALTGAGIAYIAKRGKGDEKAYLGLAALGGTAGFWLTYKAFAPHADKKTSSWDLRVAPQPMSSLSSAAKVRLVPGIGAHLKF